MNRPDKAGEPSMEEILASIRQIIADEPSSETSEPVIEANPLVPSQTPRPSEPRGPLAERLSGVFKSGPLPPTDPLGSKRPLSFDQDLADMFDDEAPSNGSLAPKPDIRVPAALSHPMSIKPFVAPVVEPTVPDRTEATVSLEDLTKDESAKPATIAEDVAALPPQFASSEPAAPTSPFGDSVAKPEDVPAPTPTFGFPPLRKASFYPPQPKAPVMPAASAPVAASPVPMPFSTPSPEPSVSAAPITAPSDAQDVLKALGGFASGISAPLGEASRSADAPVRASPPEELSTQAVGSGAPLKDDTLTSRETPYSPFTASASPSTSPSGPGAASRETPFGTAAPRAYGAAPERPVDSMPEAPVERQRVESRPVEPRSYPDPFAQTARPSSGYGAQPHFGAETSMGSDAAHQALDALAQGLAASAAAPSVPFEPVAPAVPLTPVFEASEPEERVAPTPSTLPATIASQGSMPVNRTLEDAVADMLRPMLQQWVAENMPRIIERALRTEVAQTVQPRNKPPGT